LNLPLPFFVAFTFWELDNKYKDYNENATIKLNQTLQKWSLSLEVVLFNLLLQLSIVQLHHCAIPTSTPRILNCKDWSH
jgi:hypothetical protein